MSGKSVKEGGSTINVPSKAHWLRGIFLQETGTTVQQETIMGLGTLSVQVGSTQGKYCS